MKEYRERIQYTLNTEEIYIDKVYKLEKLLEMSQINFYRYMQDNYRQINDTHVQKMELGVAHPIITIEKALEEYNRGNI
jgi:hypothetical protein